MTEEQLKELKKRFIKTPKKLTSTEREELETKEHYPIKFRNKSVLGKPLEEKCPKCGHSLYEIITETASMASLLPQIAKNCLVYSFVYSFGILGYFLFGQREQPPASPKRKMTRQIVCRNCRKVIR